jgi:hypothetical protein
VYRKHYNSIRQLTPPDRLLNFDLKDGWEPLCRFLGKPIPDFLFPRVNDREAMQARIRVIFKKRVGVLIKKVMIVAGAFGVALAGMYWYRERLEACLEQGDRARS